TRDHPVPQNFQDQIRAEAAGADSHVRPRPAGQKKGRSSAQFTRADFELLTWQEIARAATLWLSTTHGAWSEEVSTYHPQSPPPASFVEEVNDYMRQETQSLAYSRMLILVGRCLE